MLGGLSQRNSKRKPNMNSYLDMMLLYPEASMIQLGGTLILSWLALGCLLNRKGAE